ncbi:hypothetical protein B9T12_08485 [Wohlfahrtiimonas chitiniclastica]|uniref:hypothetical protein n=1 Tax=Wohlfahrtiimonas chitiniclastica TaxID=400946 RepID=UPI000B9944C8|nr:hypothetical protein [Wohlfahrtiimonas chitiniclastica]OYQ77175.1 hypothetical protein B9T12_08485 [Wohlfahrtiimonas chitiniclastica]
MNPIIFRGDYHIAQFLNIGLRNSLLERRLKRQPENWQEFAKETLVTRANHIWDHTTSNQRKGYFFAGVGFSTGKELDNVAEQVNQLLLDSTNYILQKNINDAINTIMLLANIIFSISPFVPKKGLPEDWEKILTTWLLGKNIQEEKFLDLDAALDFIEDGLIYRLPWGLEAIKVRALANEEITVETGDTLDLVVPAIENGTLNKQAAMLMQAGFNSRLAAIFAVESTDAKFQNLTELRTWLNSIAIPMSKLIIDWPGLAAQGLWEEFCRNHTVNVQGNWKTEQQSLTIELINPTSAIQKVKLIQSNTSVMLLNTRGDSLNITIPDWKLDNHGIYIAELTLNCLNVTYYGFSHKPFDGI